MSGSMDQRRVSTAKRLVEEAERYIRENYPDSGLSVERLCGHLHISQSYFSNIFKQETGRSYVQYLTDVRWSTRWSCCALRMTRPIWWPKRWAMTSPTISVTSSKRGLEYRRRSSANRLFSRDGCIRRLKTVSEGGRSGFAGADREDRDAIFRGTIRYAMSPPLLSARCWPFSSPASRCTPVLHPTGRHH